MAATAPTRLATVFGAPRPKTAPAPAGDPGAAFLHSVADQTHEAPLPEGLTADPTYLAFLRGMGMDQRTALTTAAEHQAQAKAAYATGVQRDPAVLEAAQRVTDRGYEQGGTFFSGQRLRDEAQNVTTDQQRLQDLATNRATALGGIQTDLQTQLSQLARNQADEIANLQGRRDAQTNQDKYIQAVGAANTPVTPAPAAVDPLAQYLGMILGTGTTPGKPKPVTPLAPKPAVPAAPTYRGLSSAGAGTSGF